MTIKDKDKLNYTDYRWDKDSISYQELEVIDRYNGFEILLLINHLMNEWGFKKLETFQRIEKMIREDVPLHLNSKKIIIKWIVDNW